MGLGYPQVKKSPFVVPRKTRDYKPFFQMIFPTTKKSNI